LTDSKAYDMLFLIEDIFDSIFDSKELYFMLKFKNFRKLILAVVCLSFGWAGFIRVSDAREWLGPEEKSGFKIKEIYHSLPEIKSFNGGKLEPMPLCAGNWKPSPPMVWVDFETRNYNVKPII